MKTFAIFLFTISICTFAYAESSAFNLTAPAPLTIIQNGRHQINQLLENKDLDKAYELYKEMHRRIDTAQYNVFTPYELASFDLLFGKFFFVHNLSTIDTISKYQHNKAPVPNDALMRNMQTLMQINKMIIEEKMDKLDEKLFDFCRLYLHWLIVDTRDMFVQDTLNNEADKYLEKYPEDKYARFVRLNIRRVFKRSDWGFGLSFFSGYGHFLGGLENVYTNSVLLGHSFDFFYKSIGFVFYNQFEAATKLKDSIIVSNDIWPKGAKLFQFSPAIHLGYLFTTKRAFIFPYIGIASHSASIADADTSKYNSDAETPMHSSPIIGLTLDWKLAPTDGRLVRKQEYGSWVIRTDFCVMNTRHNRYNERFSGYLFMVKIGIGGIGWPVKRDGLPQREKG